MSSIFKKPTVTAVNGRNGFDVGRSRKYTCPCGMLLPVYWDLAMAGDKYKLNTDAFIRTEAVETAAFMRLNYHVDWFFVPIRQLYKFWNEFYNGTRDVHTSFVENSVGTLNADGQPYNGNFDFPWFNIFEFVGPTSAKAQFTIGVGGVSPDDLVSARVDSFGIPLAWNFRRLYDLLGYGSISSTKAAFYALSDGSQELTFNTLGLPYLAYHRIFYSHYNNDQFFNYNPNLYNVDKYYGRNMTSINPYLRSIVSTIHYRPYRKDYFTNIQPMPSFSDDFVNSIGTYFTRNVEGLREKINPEGIYKSSLDYSQSSTSTVDDYERFAVLTGMAESNRISAGDIRALFAYDKLLRITANAGSSYDAQTFAHLGHKIPQGVRNDVYFLGSQQTPIVINEVVATSTTGSSDAGGTIGDIAGKAFGRTDGQRDINFECPDTGIIMAIASIEPIVDYASRGCEIPNRYKDTFDFFHKEFDNVGMVPMYDSFFDSVDFGIAKDVDGNNVFAIDGWTYRYSELKTKFDVVNECFWATNKASWTGTKQDLYPLRSQLDPSDAPVKRNLSFNSLFFIAPQYTNPIFLMGVPHYGNSGSYVVMASYSGNTSVARDIYFWNSTRQDARAYLKAHGGTVGPVMIDIDSSNYLGMSPNDVYGSDNFLINLDIKAFKTSVMSVHSLPRL